MLLLNITAFHANAAQLGSITVLGYADKYGKIPQAVTNYRWLIEQDDTHHVVADVSCVNGNADGCLSVHFHASNMPVIARGHSGDPLPLLDDNKRYYISVLPDRDPNGGTGFAMGGAQIERGETAVTVRVNAQPIPLAQIRVFVFEDNSPINNEPDTPAESGLAGFRLLLEDAGGRYGASGQTINTDAFGNPLGTEYDAAGNVTKMGNGTITTGPDGYVTIKNLYPAKYGIQAVPPAGSNWVQTATIEGTKIIDAWVKPNEPGFFSEFGPPGPHVFIGFVKPFKNTAVLNGGATVSGQIRSIHSSRPPDYTMYTGAPVSGCWVGLNEMSGTVAGRGVFAAPCDADSHFAIPDVPAGNYQLAVWDENLDYIFSTNTITVERDSNGNPVDLDLKDVPVFAWFGKVEQSVFFDANGNGFRDPGEAGMPDQTTNIRWRDGTIYQSVPTDIFGDAPYDEVFPFFNWLVAEVGFERFKATGLTVTVDNGGPVVAGNDLKPQPQFCTADDVSNNVDGCAAIGDPHINPNTGDNLSRTETGPVLLAGIQTFLGQTNVLEWGKALYQPGENGGITGIVFYDTTRAENNPQYAGAELWQPGIPRIQVALYEDFNKDGVIDDKNNNGVIDLADVDNYPFGNFPGPEDFDYNNDGIQDQGDAIQVTTTDSWDDNQPTGCQGDAFVLGGITSTDCFDGLRNFNQVRPAVFDGGYAFFDIPAGMYIVGTGEHRVYSTVKEEDKNVDFGDSYVIPQLLPPVCVGTTANGEAEHIVPASYSLFDLGEPPYRSGQVTPVCDMKQVELKDRQNAAADFFMFTEVPIAGHITGFILDDLSNEFDPASPNLGEKYSPPFIPVSIRDWKGIEFGRTYSDRFGGYNMLVPSSYSANLPSASGYAPNMVTTCMNDPGPIPDKNNPGKMIIDPQFKRQYSQFCYTFQYMPGTTTYLDTPVLPIAAFAGPDQFALDCESPNQTPVIWSVTNTGAGFTGPYASAAGQTIQVVSAGVVEVANPNYGLPGETKLIQRDFGFGNAGTLTVNGAAVTPSLWTNDMITFPAPATGGLIEITRADNGAKTVTGVTLTVGGMGNVITVSAGGSIQAAIDQAQSGDMVLVGPGTYEEMLIMSRPIRLQGAGAATQIVAANTTAERKDAWRLKVQGLVESGAVDLLPGQNAGFGGNGEPPTLFTEEGTGVLVLAKNSGPNRFGAANRARIDGLSISGSDNGGGIVANAYTYGLEISNNRIVSNYGIYGGGIRIGHPMYAVNRANPDIKMHHNFVAENGSGDIGGDGGAGGGFSINYGSNHYVISDNWICGNHAIGHGGGIGAQGYSPNGTITHNKILFNQSFNQTAGVDGGGIFIGGSPNPAMAPGTPGNTEGSGSVLISGNLIQGNNAGAGSGAGIALNRVNGTRDVGNGNPNNWFTVDIVDNIIVNNVAGYAGGGISLADSAKVNIVHNTIAHNDSTATAAAAFCDSTRTPACNPDESVPHPAGIVSFVHSADLLSIISQSGPAQNYNKFSNPLLDGNVIWENRAFYFTMIDNTVIPPLYGLLPDASTPDFYDLGVIGSNSYVLTPINVPPAPTFIAPYFNLGVGQTIYQIELTTTIAVQPVFDEGGNYIQVRYYPLSLYIDQALHLSDYTQ